MIWTRQWKLFAPNFRNGKANIDLAAYGCASTLQLFPGPGFGDLSHPTTRLVLHLMQPYVKDRTVVDIGCGSGILSLAAAAMGARQVYGYDIDANAVQHSQRNLSLSPFKDKIIFSLDPPPRVSSHTVFLMNMISLEQEQAWSMISENIRKPALLITSGVLAESEKQYIDLKTQHGNKLQKVLHEEGWCGFVFEIK
jgi:ribosomal protein L11 methyltransferase